MSSFLRGGASCQSNASVKRLWPLLVHLVRVYLPSIGCVIKMYLHPSYWMYRWQMSKSTVMHFIEWRNCCIYTLHRYTIKQNKMWTFYFKRWSRFWDFAEIRNVHTGRIIRNCNTQSEKPFSNCNVVESLSLKPYSFGESLLKMLYIINSCSACNQVTFYGY